MVNNNQLKATRVSQRMQLNLYSKCIMMDKSILAFYTS
nr:MAG TPA: hypothetical protein [Caudoviricetes sp.]